MTTTLDSTLARSKILVDTVVPARSPWSGWVQTGEVLRLIDLEGQQAVDFLCYNASDYADRYHAANTIKLAGDIYLNQGSVLWSVRARKMMTIIADTCGSHDTIFGCCSFELDKVRYGQTNSESCQRNFERELQKYGMSEKDVVSNINFFMNVPVKNGRAAIVDGQSQPGDYVDLRAEMDVLVVLSNCPEALNPATGTQPTPIQVLIYKPENDNKPPQQCKQQQSR